jgi:acetyltransferase-like isoleucine patch superfamily enzyme
MKHSPFQVDGGYNNSLMSNSIHETAFVDVNIQLGEYNSIGKNVTIKYLDEKIKPKVIIGDNNVINDNTRILIGSQDVVIGDWNVFHNDMLILGGNGLHIGHNCWFGQNTILDGSGKLQISNGVRVGMYSQIWTHVASGELIEGCLLFGERETIIEDDVWLVGSCVVSSGVRLRKKSVFLINSVITKDSESEKVYSGSPAKMNEKINVWRKVELTEKLIMMLNWAYIFCASNKDYSVRDNIESGYFGIISSDEKENLVIFIEDKFENSYHKNITLFNLVNKTYTKTNSELERKFYKFIYNHKARFIPFKN